jgi:site-specific DNA-methyltransferase (adenine-specific)
MKTMRDNSVDSIVTDPPAGIAFMGKDWDKNKGGRDKWIEWMTGVASECLRVLKPGGHALVWSIPRTSHWTATAWEDGGFEVRDRIAHIFGSGFPKSLNVGKQIDKMAGVEREISGKYRPPNGTEWNLKQAEDQNIDAVGGTFTASGRRTLDITAPATPESQQWDGWGTALKPSIEDWWLFRKPLSEKTVAANALKWGTGAINIDRCRVPINPEIDDSRLGGNGSWKTDKAAKNIYEGGYAGNDITSSPNGRWPAQVIHDGSEEVVALFPQSTSGWRNSDKPNNAKGVCNSFGANNITGEHFGDSGSAARFFYCAKPSRKERDAGLNEFEEKQGDSLDGGADTRNGKIKTNQPMRKNHHPTVKPISLMRYLITLITPPEGTILDPFLGSGTTLVAAKELGFSGRGIENDSEYLEIAKKRIENAKSGILEV